MKLKNKFPTASIIAIVCGILLLLFAIFGVGLLFDYSTYSIFWINCLKFINVLDY